MTLAEMVEEFQEKFQTNMDPKFWLTLVKEELAEVQKASAELLKEYCDLMYVMQGGVFSMVQAGMKFETVLALQKRLCQVRDISNACFGRDVVDEALRRVHASNMSKLLDDGTVLRREDGKVLKGPNYKPPVLDDLLD